MWAVEQFKKYVYGEQFKIISDHKTLMSVLKPNRRKKSFSSKLTTWVDRSFLFDLDALHVAGRTLGMAEYWSRHPSELQEAVLNAETLWIEWFTVNSVISLNDVGEKNEASSEQSKPAECVNESFTVNRIKEAKQREPIKARDGLNSRGTSKKYCFITARTRKKSQSPSIKLLNEKLLPANYIADKLTQRVIRLSKNFNKTRSTRLESPWREKLYPILLDYRDFFYMD